MVFLLLLLLLNQQFSFSCRRFYVLSGLSFLFSFFLCLVFICLVFFCFCNVYKKQKKTRQINAKHKKKRNKKKDQTKHNVVVVVVLVFIFCIQKYSKTNGYVLLLFCVCLWSCLVLFCFVHSCNNSKTDAFV